MHSDEWNNPEGDLWERLAHTHPHLPVQKSRDTRFPLSKSKFTDERFQLSEKSVSVKKQFQNRL